MKQPAIKWTGSKKYQAKQIVDNFPKKIDTYYECFVGGASVLFELLHREDIEVNRYICSDINKDLINTWNGIKNNYKELIKEYRIIWEEFNLVDDIQYRKDYYIKIRNRFNKERSISDFIFLNRTCINGIIRYNKKGEFNSSCHFTRKGIHPDTLEKIFKYYSNILNKKNVEFKVSSYEEIETTNSDLIYCDPPYEKTKGLYFGNIDYIMFWSWVKKQDGYVFVSYDGIRGDEDYTVNNSYMYYDKHIYINNGTSSFNSLFNNKITKVLESLYIKRNV